MSFNEVTLGNSLRIDKYKAAKDKQAKNIKISPTFMRRLNKSTKFFSQYWTKKRLITLVYPLKACNKCIYHRFMPNIKQCNNVYLNLFI
jgi:hypothetical protein